MVGLALPADVVLSQAYHVFNDPRFAAVTEANVDAWVTNNGPGGNKKLAAELAHAQSDGRPLNPQACGKDQVEMSVLRSLQPCRYLAHIPHRLT